MKIIYLHQYFKFPYESGGTRSFDLATGFVASGHSVEIITSTSDENYKTGERWNKIEKDRLIVHYIYLPYGNHLSYFQRSLVFFQFLYFSTLKLLSLKGDIVLATSTPLTIGIPALIKKWLHKIPFIFETRDVWPEAVIAIGAIKNKYLQQILYLLESVIYNNAAAIVPLSVDMKHSIVSRHPQLGKKQIEVIENISEINRFQNGFSTKVSVLKEKIGSIPRFTILYAGTFGRVNGIDYVISLAEKLILIDPTIVFVLIGDGAEKKSIIQEAEDKKVLNKNVFILDSVSKQDLPQLYFECSMGSSFVIAVKEFWANSANKFFDTLAAGKPILINHKGWQKEVITKENIGYVLPDVINDESAATFALYTQNGKLITTQQANALQIAKENYGLDVAVLKYNKVIKEIFVNVKK
jgi:glycosyltransferase involved in cell wall biosynthesis